MELHVVLPAESADTGWTPWPPLARRAEELGYSGIYLPDHLAAAEAVTASPTAGSTSRC